MIHIYESMEQYNQRNSHSKEKRLGELANIVFEELSSGLYHVKKDRMGHMLDKEFVDVREVSGAMNRREKVVIIGNDGRIYANTDFLEHL